MKQMLIALTLLMLGIGLIQAQEEGEVPDFSALDANQDGLISREESSAATVVESNFTTADTDRNGYLNQEEFDALIDSIL